MIKVTVWNEYAADQKSEAGVKAYPQGIHAKLKEFLSANEDMQVRVSLLDDPENGLTREILDDTDVLVYWAHMRHGDLPDEKADLIAEYVQKGMGAIFLHAAHKSKPFGRLTGTSGCLQWREAEEREQLWVIDPTHPIAAGLPQVVTIEPEEMYGEPFDIPKPDELVFIGWFQGGNVFRSGVTYKRGYGKVFYFQPGHETHKTYYQPEIQHIITNAVRWAVPVKKLNGMDCPCAREPIETIHRS